METFCLWLAALSQACLLIYLFTKYRFVTHKQAYHVARILACIAHKDDKDKVGENYNWHLDRVQRGVKSIPEKIVAWLHDIVEDGHLSHDELKTLGVFTDEELYSIRALDKKCTSGLGLTDLVLLGNDDKFGRMSVIHRNRLARPVKIADLKDNMDATRFLKAGKEITEEDRKRFSKYQEQLSYLEDR